ncbi:MAG: hypothetical protein WED83_08165 [Acidimicrobiia bacterium]
MPDRTVVVTGASSGLGAHTVRRLPDLELMLRTNVIGPYLCTKAALPYLIEAKGVVVNIGSTVVAGLRGIVSVMSHRKAPSRQCRSPSPVTWAIVVSE